MPEFLVAVHVRFPADMSPDERAAVIEAERVRGRELRSAGVIQRIWRVPGALRNVAIWSAADATELHAALMSLPAAPWCEMEVTALAVHALEGGDDA
ncbi:MAG TPA: muconolactone Delta-isomerase family protein [Conexibacter sp.]